LDSVAARHPDGIGSLDFLHEDLLGADMTGQQARHLFA